MIEYTQEKQQKQEEKLMTEEAKEARRAYKREWNRNNKDKIKAAQARYWEKQALKKKTKLEANADDSGIVEV